jgi:hypothetical protein
MPMARIFLARSPRPRQESAFIACRFEARLIAFGQ